MEARDELVDGAGLVLVDAGSKRKMIPSAVEDDCFDGFGSREVRDDLAQGVDHGNVEDVPRRVVQRDPGHLSGLFVCDAHLRLGPCHWISIRSAHCGAIGMKSESSLPSRHARCKHSS